MSNLTNLTIFDPHACSMRDTKHQSPTSYGDVGIKAKTRKGTGTFRLHDVTFCEIFA
jgi:hypothetical protein